MSNQLIAVILPLCLMIVMAGLGLELTVRDFVRVKNNPKVIVIALFCQLVLLVAAAFAVCVLLGLPPVLAVGMMMLAASPGGATANLFSYLYKGDVALNISLTAVNALIAAVSFPLIVNAAVAYFLPDGQQLGLQFGKVLQVFVIILLPVAAGMALRHCRPHLAEKLQRFVRLFATVFLLLIIVGAVAAERANAAEYIRQVGPAAALFCLLSLSTGYFVPKLFGVGKAQARACAFEIGIHNSTLAMTIAITLLDSPQMAIPAAIYSIVMYVFGVAFGTLLNRFDPIEPRA
ncbi:bile acid:sodium symporter family protein [Neisseria leonii]|uniref:Bile acid:sodium symporter family protein n=1 Tax=Neisseria leonii TaxID=2995413 RepID=A0A9X4E5D7_9NEIS|nr:bile acid:sodium symporter family protein [Neisseria sp. 51.81]MDD9328216.1 bile acid:sodium symporter family protein [Neisseria sp. 51.81]